MPAFLLCHLWPVHLPYFVAVIKVQSPILAKLQLTFDFPLEQLKKYTRTNPCPHDFDEFWEKSLIEMRSINSEIQLVPAVFQVPGVDCFNLYFTGAGGSN